MADLPEFALPEAPKLAGNITHFARALRHAGLPVGPGRVLDAVRAGQAAGFTRREDFYWALHATLVSRREHHRVFHQVFNLFWRDPRYMEKMMAMLLPALHGAQENRPADAAQRRAAEALLDGVPRAAGPETGTQDPGEEAEIEIDARFTMSAEERLRRLDFEQMSADEAKQAKHMLARLSLPVRPLPARRTHRDPLGARADPQRSLRLAMRRGGELAGIARKSPRLRWPNLVVLCDISGSMAQYSRMVLHFLHAVANRQGQGWARVHGFTFGTRLTNITRQLATRDVDAALAAVGQQAPDWEGGTRIGACLHSFNGSWLRRVSGGPGAVVLLITDGLERDAPGLLSREMQRLHLSARRLIWLNPLLRWDGFAPRAAGIRAMLPHVDTLRAGHSIATLGDLAVALSDPADAGDKTRLMAALSENGA